MVANESLEKLWRRRKKKTFLPKAIKILYWFQKKTECKTAAIYKREKDGGAKVKKALIFFIYFLFEGEIELVSRKFYLFFWR
jgi:hypothetical protein